MCLKPRSHMPWSHNPLIIVIEVDNKAFPVGEYEGWEYVAAKDSYNVIYNCHGVIGRVPLERVFNKADVLRILEKNKRRYSNTFTNACCEIGIPESFQSLSIKNFNWAAR